MSAQVLNSWKEIAAYVGRGVRTIQRWEQELAFPVRRPRGNHTAVTAVKEEIDRWFRMPHGAPRNGNGRRVIFEVHRRLLNNTAVLQSNASRLLAGCMVLEREMNRALANSSTLQVNFDKNKNPRARPKLMQSNRAQNLRQHIARATELVMKLQTFTATAPAVENEFSPTPASVTSVASVG